MKHTWSQFLAMRVLEGELEWGKREGQSEKSRHVQWTRRKY